MDENVTNKRDILRIVGVFLGENNQIDLLSLILIHQNYLAIHLNKYFKN
jgi:hypothetical protein